MRKQGGEKDPNYEYIFALYNSASRKKSWCNFSKDKTFAGSHSVTYRSYLGSSSVRFFYGIPLSKRGVSFSNFGTVRGLTQ